MVVDNIGQVPSTDLYANIAAALNLLTQLSPSRPLSPPLYASLLKFKRTVRHTDAPTIPDAGPNVRKLKLFQ